MAVGLNLLEAGSLGEFGYSYELDLSTQDAFASLMGSALARVERVSGKRFGDDLGFVLLFDRGPLYVLNFGDELHIGKESPKS